MEVTEAESNYRLRRDERLAAASAMSNALKQFGADSAEYRRAESQWVATRASLDAAVRSMELSQKSAPHG